MAWTNHPIVSGLRSRHATADFTVEVVDGYRRHRTGRNSAVLAYYGFLSLFPLFLVATTVTGYLLEDRPRWRRDLIGSAVASVPFIGDELATTGTINGSLWALTVGLAVAIWGSLKAFVALQAAYDDIWEVPLDDRGSLVSTRVKALVGIAVLGGAQVVTVALGAVAAETDIRRVGHLAIIAGGLMVNLIVVGTMFRFLTTVDVGWRSVAWGTALAASVFTAMHFGGTRVVTALHRSTRTYGEFAAIISLLAWLSVHAIANLLGAEINAALSRRSARISRCGDSPGPVR